jgi:hypothetical protein
MPGATKRSSWSLRSLVPAAAGIGYSAAWVAGLVIWLANLDVTSSGAEVVAAVRGHQGAAMAQYVLVEGVAAVMLAIVMVSVGRAASRQGAGELGTMAMVTGITAAALSLVQCVLGLLLAGSAVPNADAGQAGTLFSLINRIDGVKMFVLAIMTLAGEALARDGVLPRWLGYVGVLAAIALVASGIGYVFLVNPFALAAFASLPLLLLWVTGAGVALTLTRR